MAGNPADPAALPAGERQRHLVCHCRDERYAVDFRWVQEIDFEPRILKLPSFAPPLLGLVEWLGREVPAVRLNDLLGYAGDGPGATALKVQLGTQAWAILVDRIGETITEDQGQGFALTALATGGRAWLSRAVRIGEDLVYLLDLEQLLAGVQDCRPAPATTSIERGGTT